MPIVRIIPEVRSNDIEATRSFYTRILGLEVGMEQDSFLMLSSPANRSAQLIVNDNGFPGLPPGFVVDVGSEQQLENTYRAVMEQGLTLVEPLDDKPWGIRRFSVLDPSGTRVTVVCHIESQSGKGPP